VLRVSPRSSARACTAHLQAAIGDRIDRSLPREADVERPQRSWCRFRAELLERLLERTDLTPLIEAELVDQVT